MKKHFMGSMQQKSPIHPTMHQTPPLLLCNTKWALSVTQHAARAGRTSAGRLAEAEKNHPGFTFSITSRGTEEIRRVHSWPTAHARGCCATAGWSGAHKAQRCRRQRRLHPSARARAQRADRFSLALRDLPDIPPPTTITS